MLVSVQSRVTRGILAVAWLVGTIAVFWIAAQGKAAAIAMHSAGLSVNALQLALYTMPLWGSWVIGALVLGAAGAFADRVADRHESVSIFGYCLLLLSVNALLYYYTVFAPFAAPLAP